MMVAWAVVAILAVALVALAVSWFEKRSQLDRALQVIEDAERERREAIEEAELEHEGRIRRLKREREQERQRAHLPLARELLPGLDALASALDAADARGDATSADQELVRGLQMVERSLLEALTRHGVEALQPSAGDPFDPARHEAVALVEVEDVPPRHVVGCMRRGYWMPEGAHVLRPAMVTVAQGVAVEADAAPPVEHAGEGGETAATEAAADEAADVALEFGEGGEEEQGEDQGERLMSERSAEVPSAASST